VHRQVLSPAARTHLVEEAQRRNPQAVRGRAERRAPPRRRALPLRGGGDRPRPPLLHPRVAGRGRPLWQPGRAELTGEPTVRLSLPFPSSVPMPTAIPRRRRRRARIGPPDTKPMVAPDVARLLGSAELDAVGRHLLRRLRRTKSVGPCSASPRPGGAHPGAISACCWRGPPGAGGHRVAEPGRDLPLTREECQLRLSLPVESDHLRRPRARPQGARPGGPRVLLPPGPPLPPRTASAPGPLADFLGMAEVYFTKVTEAYNTLIRPESRQEYDRQLAEPQMTADTAKSDTQYLARQNFVRGKSLPGAPAPRGGRALPGERDAPGRERRRVPPGARGSSSPATRASARRRSAISCAPPSSSPPPPRPTCPWARSTRAPAAPRTPRAMFREVLRWDPGNVQASAQLAELGPVGTWIPPSAGGRCSYGG
jgi:hypothetical protein